MFDERNQSLTANKKEYFFDRNSDAFATILDFYRTAGCLCKPGGLSPRLWKKELDYWAIPPDVDSEFIEEEADEEEQVHISLFATKCILPKTTTCRWTNQSLRTKKRNGGRRLGSCIQ